MYHNNDENCYYRFIDYVKNKKPSDEYNYLNLLKNIMGNGIERPDRTGVGTKSIFSPNPLRFDISESIPIVTTKFLSFKMVLLELLWFLKGQTDSKILEKEGINIWKLNTTRKFLDNRGLSHLREGDLGELYGISFRAFNAVYKGCDHNHIGEGVDQIQNLIQNLKDDPFSRRHLMTTFNPASVSRSCLWPCHGVAIMFYVDEIDQEKYLSCHVVNRSQDTVLGVPTKNLIVSMGDAHIYQNHYEQVKLQLSRKPMPFASLKISDDIVNKPIEQLDVKDFELIGYLYHPRIAAPMAV